MCLYLKMGKIALRSFLRGPNVKKSQVTHRAPIASGQLHRNKGQVWEQEQSLRIPSKLVSEAQGIEAGWCQWQCLIPVEWGLALTPTVALHTDFSNQSSGWQSSVKWVRQCMKSGEGQYSDCLVWEVLGDWGSFEGSFEGNGASLLKHLRCSQRIPQKSSLHVLLYQLCSSDAFLVYGTYFWSRTERRDDLKTALEISGYLQLLCISSRVMPPCVFMTKSKHTFYMNKVCWKELNFWDWCSVISNSMIPRDCSTSKLILCFS